MEVYNRGPIMVLLRGNSMPGVWFAVFSPYACNLHDSWLTIVKPLPPLLVSVCANHTE